MAEETNDKADSQEKTDKKRRTIPGNFAYTTTPGKLKTVLQNLINAERPDTFNKSYIETYLGVTGGSAAPIPNVMKRVDFIGGDGRPTEWYAKFQTDSGRPEASLHGLKKAFSEIFKKNTFAHSLSEEKVREIIVEITGLVKTDPIVSQIFGTFDAFRGFIPSDYVGNKEQPRGDTDREGHQDPPEGSGQPLGKLGLSYHVNIVLPETKDVAVYNAIFQSLKANLL